MNYLSSIFCLFLGLVIQLSPVQPCQEGDVESKCVDVGMSCCSGLQSCPCAKESEPDQQPAPVFPPATDLKLLISKAPGTDHPAALIFPPEDVPDLAGTSVESGNGYAGVPLSVAFCSFVI